LADGKLQALTVDQQSIVGGLDVWKHAVVSERVSQLLAVGRDTVQRSCRKGYQSDGFRSVRADAADDPV
jgi:hypothetical protein